MIKCKFQITNALSVHANRSQSKRREHHSKKARSQLLQTVNHWGKKKGGGGAVKAVMHDSNVTVIVHKWENGMRISRKHKRMEIFWSEDTAAMTTKKSVCV